MTPYLTSKNVPFSDKDTLATGKTFRRQEIIVTIDLT